jgi:hypothetical protein
VDVLQDHLARARASGGVFARSVAQPPWGLRLPGTIQLAVHAVIQGRAWLWLDDPQAPLELAPGDVALVRGGPTTTSLTHPPRPACCQNSSGPTMPAMNARAIGARACSCAAHTGSPATSAEA